MPFVNIKLSFIPMAAIKTTCSQYCSYNRLNFLLPSNEFPVKRLGRCFQIQMQIFKCFQMSYDCRKHLKVRLNTAGSSRQKCFLMQETTSACKIFIYKQTMNISPLERDRNTNTADCQGNKIIRNRSLCEEINIKGIQ